MRDGEVWKMIGRHWRVSCSINGRRWCQDRNGHQMPPKVAAGLAVAGAETQESGFPHWATLVAFGFCGLLGLEAAVPGPKLAETRRETGGVTMGCRHPECHLRMPSCFDSYPELSTSAYLASSLVRAWRSWPPTYGPCDYTVVTPNKYTYSTTSLHLSMPPTEAPSISSTT